MLVPVEKVADGSVDLQHEYTILVVPLASRGIAEMQEAAAKIEEVAAEFNLEVTIIKRS